MNDIYIAGASSRARTTKEYLEQLNPDVKVRAFLVSPEMEDNLDIIDELNVIKISRDNNIDVSVKVYIGTRGINHAKIRKELIEIGFLEANIIPVTVELDIKLRNEYVKKQYAEHGKKFLKFNDLYLDSKSKPDICDDVKMQTCIYQVSSVYDGALSDRYVPLKEEKTIQVGAALTEDRVYKNILTDNVGDNISKRNKQFCELTGLYWIWKNAEEDIAGLAHYRRHFLLPKEWVSVFEKADVDVILPVPLCVVPSLEENYKSRHLGYIWDKLFEIMDKYHPEDVEIARDYFKNNNLYSPCNMIIAKKGILDEYCGWLFPMLIELSDEVGVVDDAYQNRFPGFLSERLLTYYFETKSKLYKIVYADKNFLK